MIKKFLITTLLIIFSFNISFLNNTNASNFVIYEDDKKMSTELNKEDIFKYISVMILKDIPESYKYIKLNYTDIKPIDKSYSYVQKLVYVNAIPNKNVKLNLKTKLNAYHFFSIIKYVTWFDFITEKNIDILKSRNVKYSDLAILEEVFAQDKENSIEESDEITLSDIFASEEEKNKFMIYMDIYNTLLTDYYNKSDLKQTDLIYSSITWLANWSKDKFTTFFPPTESKDFEESLSWEFEWIWSYVDMEKPWVLKIISPISWSPAEKAWLKWWDIIKKVNWEEITDKMTVNDAVNLIKWPAWSKVILTILRDENEITIEVVRAKIVVKDVEYKNLNNWFFYIQMRMFWDNVFTQFENSIDELKKSQVKKLIIDLRNNPWGYLEQVTEILSLFIPKWEKTAVIKYRDYDQNYYSSWFDKINLNDYEVYILLNSWTASASEIMAWTLKDYFPNIKLIWEKTYWKWSVQTIRSYYDWSSFKYTIAKWFTWKNQIWIDWVWISPDEEVVLDAEKFKNWIDNQLDYILKKY